MLLKNMDKRVILATSGLCARPVPGKERGRTGPCAALPPPI